MSREASEFQYKVMSIAYRGKEIFKPLNTGWIDERVACVREYVANVFFYRKGETTLMIDAGYNYDRLGEKMGWLGIDPTDVRDILITHQDTDHVGAVERDAPGLFRTSTLYVGRRECRYLTGETRRRVYWGTYRLPQVTIDNVVVPVDDGEVLHLGDVKVEALLVAGHTWGHMAYLVDDAYLFTGDALWLGPDGGKCFIDALAEDVRLQPRSLERLRSIVCGRGLRPKVITGHTGWTDDCDFAFAHIDETCHALRRQRPRDPCAPYDAYVETDDTESMATGAYLAPARRVPREDDVRFWNRAAFVYDIATRAGEEGLLQAADYVVSFAGELDVALDAACGTGAFACALARKVSFVAACDLSPNMVAAARRKAMRLGVSDVAFGVADICAMPFADDTFDIAVAGNVLHLLGEPERALAELCRVVRPTGYVALPTYVNAESCDRRFLRLIQMAGFSAVFEWDEAGYLSFLERAGMRVVESRMFSAERPLCVAICQVV